MKTKRERIPKTEVLDWLHANHPRLHAVAEIDREWVWLVANLRGDEHLATRESIKEYGFIFSRHGGHPLPSGKLGTWGHSCVKPMPFRRKGKGNHSKHENNTNEITLPRETAVAEEDREALAFALG